MSVAADQASPPLQRVGLARFFKVLADPTRLALLDFVLHEERTVSECVAHVGLSQGRVSAHLGCLAQCGFVEVRREGRFAYYRVADPRVADLVALAHDLTSDHSSALSACAVVGTAATARRSGSPPSRER
jgi:DNA-binding transcriptional ArsR family regulator